MSPSKNHKRGTFVLDFQVKGIGRIRRASGTSDVATLKNMKAMFRVLRQKGRLDIIRAVADGVVTPMDAWDRFRTDKLDRLPTAETMRRLWPMLEEWAEQIPDKDKHRRNSAHGTVLALAKVEKKATANVSDLPKLLTRYKAVCEKAGHAQMFRNARNNVRAFLRDSLGKTHPLYLEVAAMTGLPVDRSAGNPFTATELATFLSAMEAKHGTVVAGIARALAFSGMRPVEYWGEWHQATPTVIKVRTAKQRKGKKAKVRRAPVVVEIDLPTLARRTFEDKMRDVTRDHVCYDLRRTYMHLMEQARIPRSRRMNYMGHSAGDVSDRYEEHEVTEYLVGDVEALRAYLIRTAPDLLPGKLT